MHGCSTSGSASCLWPVPRPPRATCGGPPSCSSDSSTTRPRRGRYREVCLKVLDGTYSPYVVVDCTRKLRERVRAGTIRNPASYLLGMLPGEQAEYEGTPGHLAEQAEREAAKPSGPRPPAEAPQTPAELRAWIVANVEGLNRDRALVQVNGWLQRASGSVAMVHEALVRTLDCDPKPGRISQRMGTILESRVKRARAARGKAS